MFAFFLACATPSPATDTADTGRLPGGGGADMPAYCAEDHRVLVDDPSVPAADFAFAVSDALAAQVGPWSGTLTPYQGDAVGLDLTVAEAGLGIAAVYRVLVDPNQGETGSYGEGAPDVGDCPPVYEYSLTVDVATTDGAYAAQFQPLVQVAAAETATFFDTVALADFTGTAPPGVDATRWAFVSFGVDATLADAAWTGSFLWYGASAAPVDGSAESDTGTVEPSGETAGVGGFSVSRTK